MATSKRKDIVTDKKGEIVTKAMFAKIMGTYARTVTRWEAEGMPSHRHGRGRATKINTVDAITWLINREVQHRAPDKSGPVDIDLERLRLVSEQADEKEISNAISRGELIASEFVNEFVMTAVANLSGTLGGLPGRLANKIAYESDPAKCRDILKREIDRARSQYADTFDQLSESFEDRIDGGVDGQAAA